MVNFNLIPFEKEHIYELVKNGIRQGYTFADVGDSFDAVSEIHSNNKGFTLMADNEILGCGGVDVVGDEGLAWLAVSPKIKEYKKTVVKTIKVNLNNLIQESGINTVFAIVDNKDTIAQRLVDTLNFVYQPDMPKITGPDKNEYIIYRRVA